MLKTNTFFLVFMLSFFGLKAQTNIMVYSEDFESGGPGVQLNTSDLGSNTGKNLWVINNLYNGAPQYPNTTDESVTVGGNISFAPYSHYLHITDSTNSTGSCDYDPTTPSDHFVLLTNGFCTQGITNVKLTFFYLAQGSSTAYGVIMYSVDGGPWISTGTQYNNQPVWQYTILQNTAFDNVANLRFGILWVNDAGALPGKMSFGIDDIYVTGIFDNFLTNFNVIVDSITPNPICQNFGLLIYYHLTVPICGNGFFEVQLSNSAGSFTSPTSLGIYMASNSYMSSILWPTIPSATPAGTCYMIRIKYYFTDYGLSFYSNTSVCFEVQQCANTITTLQPVVTMGGDSICVGSVIDIPFYSTGVFQTANNYIAQLSDSNGLFTSNLNILGSKPDHKTYDPALGSSPGSVSGLINENNQYIPDGCNYYIRVVSTNPVATGLQWGPFCIKHCDIETNHKLDIKACITSTQGFDTTVYVNIHYSDSSGTAAVYNPANNQFMLEVHNSQNFAVIPPLGGLGSITACNDTTLHINVPNATMLSTLGLSPGLYYLRVVATNSNHSWDVNGTLIRLLIGAPADNLWILQDPADSILCIGDAVFFYAIPYNSGPPMNSTYQWFLNGALWPNTDAGIGILFNGAGTYNLTLQETNYGCVGPLTPNSASLHVLAPPTAAIIGPLQVCLGDTIYYHVVFHPDVYYEWTTTGGALVDTSNNELYIRFDTVGVYTINLLCLNKCGQALGHKNVIVTEHQDPSFTIVPTTICTGDSVVVKYTGTSSPPLTYVWNFGGGAALPGGNNPGPHHVAWTTPGQHAVILDISKYSCHTLDTNFINVIQMPASLFTVDSVCLGTPTAFVDSSHGSPSAYLWNFGDGTPTSAQANPTHTYADTGSYNVQLIVSNNVCKDTIMHAAFVKQIPTALFTTVTPVCFGQTSTITYAGNAPSNAAYTWNFPGANVISGSGQGPFVISMPDSGYYHVMLSVVQDACHSAPTTDSIKVKNCEKPKLIIPNVFTPNGDGQNDVFFIQGLDKYPQSILQIFNRWGNLVYESTDYKNDWNCGECGEGVYYYILIVKEGTSYHGTVTVIR